jgi:thiamine biosynthesis lipoprotein
MLNHNTGRKTEISLELSPILEEALKVSGASGGAFDITIGKAVELWDIDTWAAAEDMSGFRLPEKEELSRTLADVGYEKIFLEEGEIMLPEGMKLDMGAIGKGIACDWAQDYLSGRDEVLGAAIAVGGSVLVYGGRPDGKPWKVGIAHPREEGRHLGTLTLEGTWHVSTSGDYERYVEVSGVRYHHILDPADGYPADSGIVSVTILCKSGLLSEALSTACFVLGVEKGLELAQTFQVHALIMDEQGDIHMTEGMETYWEAG